MTAGDRTGKFARLCKICSSAGQKFWAGLTLAKLRRRPVQDSKRDTFLSVAQLLERATERCARAAEMLERCEAGEDQTHRSLLEDVAADQRELVQQLELYRRDGPENVLTTRLQYRAPEREQQAPHSAQEALQYTTAVNNDVAQLLEEQVLKLAAPETAEQLEDLHQAVVSTNRQISMARVTGEDI